MWWFCRPADLALLEHSQVEFFHSLASSVCARVLTCPTASLCQDIIAPLQVSYNKPQPEP